MWFFEQVLQCFGGIQFVWMTDQGTALTCDAVGELLDREGQFESLCAKHVIKTIEVAKTRKELEDRSAGWELIFRFARSRTREWGDQVLEEIERKIMTQITFGSAATKLRARHFWDTTGVVEGVSRHSWWSRFSIWFSLFGRKGWSMVSFGCARNFNRFSLKNASL